MAGAPLDASLVALLALVTVSDLRTGLIPDRALLIALAVAAPLCALEDPSDLPARSFAGLGAAAFLLAVSLARPEGMGLGDVKLVGVIGVYLGEAVVAALLVAFAAGSVAGLVVIARHGWAARSRAIPFAPFLALGALVAIAAQP